MRSFFIATVISLAQASLSFAYADDDAQQSVSAAPAAALQALSPLLGEWRVTLYRLGEAGEWVEESADDVFFEPSLNGLLLTERMLQRISGEGFELKTDYMFDQYRDVYRLAVADDTFGLMDIYEGQLEDGALIVTNLKSGTGFPLDAETMMNFRLTIPVASGNRQMTIDQSTDAGATWRPFYRADYARIVAD